MCDNVQMKNYILLFINIKSNFEFMMVSLGVELYVMEVLFYVEEFDLFVSFMNLVKCFIENLYGFKHGKIICLFFYI